MKDRLQTTEILLPEMKERLSSDLLEISALLRKIESGLQSKGWPEQAQFSIRMALEEALANAMKHGNWQNAEEPTEEQRERRVEVTYSIVQTRPFEMQKAGGETGKRKEVDMVFIAEIQDQGNGFDPSSVADPTAPDALEKPCGRGLMLMRHFMDDVEFLPTAAGTRVRLMIGAKRLVLETVYNSQ